MCLNNVVLDGLHWEIIPTVILDGLLFPCRGDPCWIAAWFTVIPWSHSRHPAQLPVLHRERASDSEQEAAERSGDETDSEAEVETKGSVVARQLIDVMEGTRVPAGKFAFTLRSKALSSNGDIVELEVLLPSYQG